MKRLVFLVCGAVGLACGAELSAVRTVYVMPMYRGLDQYLANRLTNQHVFQVVTDPKLADAVITDRIGEAFQIQLDGMMPAPPPPPEPPAPPEKPEKKANAEPEPAKSILPTETVNKLDNPGLNSTFGRGKGTIFLVDAKGRTVIWSDFAPAKSTDSKEMDRTASAIVDHIMKDLGTKKK